MGRVFDELYERCRGRVTEIAAGLTPDQLATTVPATPLWTAQELIAHLAGVASDAISGRVQGVTTEPWTAAQVSARAGHTVQEMLAEWAQDGPKVAAALGAREMSPMIVHDALTHEADLREAFGLGALPADVVDAALGKLARAVCRGYRGPGSLTLRAGEHEWSGGEGPAVSARTSPYELYRALISRRSREQMRSWTWTGDADPVIEALPAFGLPG